MPLPDPPDPRTMSSFSFKDRLCPVIEAGGFCNGERCSYIHEYPAMLRKSLSLGRDRENSVITVRTTESPLPSGSRSDQPHENFIMNSSFDSSRLNQKSSYWKTKICFKWVKTSHCWYGDKCRFAHGQAELLKSGGHNEVEMAHAGTASCNPLPVSWNNEVEMAHKGMASSSHLPASGNNEVEMTHTGMTSSNPLPASGNNDMSASNTATGYLSKQRKKNILMLKGVKGINGLYGDWPDDLLPIE